MPDVLSTGLGDRQPGIEADRKGTSGGGPNQQRNDGPPEDAGQEPPRLRAQRRSHADLAPSLSDDERHERVLEPVGRLER
jgi:hypothetical protein